jgi:hypothetical protein
MLLSPGEHGRGTPDLDLDRDRDRDLDLDLALALVGAKLAREAFGVSDDAIAGKPCSYKGKAQVIVERSA